MNSPAVIEYATADDLAFLAEFDRHAGKAVLAEKISRRELLIARLKGNAIGWLRFNYFWDSIPMINLLKVLEAHRRKGVASDLLQFWEQAMKQLGHAMVLTSTQSNEQGQHFFRRLGYGDIGGFVLPGEPLEIILAKWLD